MNIGLKPTLTLKTQSNGAISVCSEVTSVMPEYPPVKSRRSGAKSRQRRSTTRAQARSKAAEEAVNAIQPLDALVTTQNRNTSPELPPQLSHQASNPTSSLQSYKTKEISFKTNPPELSCIEDLSMPREDVSKVDPPPDQLVSNLPRGKAKMITCDTCSLAFSYQDFKFTMLYNLSVISVQSAFAPKKPCMNMRKSSTLDTIPRTSQEKRLLRDKTLFIYCTILANV